MWCAHQALVANIADGPREKALATAMPGAALVGARACSAAPCCRLHEKARCVFAPAGLHLQCFTSRPPTPTTYPAEDLGVMGLVLNATERRVLNTRPPPEKGNVGGVARAA